MGWMRRRRISAAVDDGFTLVEVIVALMLMSIVLMAGGGFMIRTVTASSAMSGRQDAVTVANQVLEQIRAVNPTFDASGTSPLVYGRGKTEVVNQWAAAAVEGLDVSDTYTGSGATAFDADTYQTSTASPTVPLQQTIALGGESYTVKSLIGTCVRPTAGTECNNLGIGFELFRVSVRVTWTPGAGKNCSGRPCAYGVSTLIDPTVEPVFNASRKPVANPDNASTLANTAVSIGVTVNDSGDFALAGAVTILTSPANGTLSLSNNIVTYTPSAGFSGTNSFTYTVTDLTSRTSNVATVTVTVTPVAVNDTASAAAGAAPLTIAVLSNDKGTGLSLVALSVPSIGSAVISGTSIRYTVPTTGSGTATVTYTAKDSSGQQYTGTLTITVTGPSAVALGSVAAYSVFAGTSVTNTGVTSLSGSLGATSTITGFPPGIVAGATNVANGSATLARSALTTAYNDAAGRTAVSSFSGDLNGKTFTAGVYKTGAAMALTGTVTLDGGGDPNAVFIFQINGAMNTAAASNVSLINGAQAANVFWQVTGAAGTGAASSFSGTILSAGAITVGAGGQLRGRALSYAAITLANNTFP